MKKGSTTKTRDSNFELLRIVSMFMIVFWHIMIHGNVISNTTGTGAVVMKLMQALVFIHVNSYILVMGYFQCKSKVRVGKAISINNGVWFYKILFTLLVVITGAVTLGPVEFIQRLTPINYYDYWFIILYLILYLISPILNKIIEHSDQKSHGRILIICFLIFSILPTVTGQLGFNNMNGYSLANFIFLYLIGAYLRKYPVTENYYFKKFTPKAKQLLFLGGYLACAFLIFSITVMGNQFSSLSPVLAYIGSLINKAFNAYDNPLLIIESVCYVLFFSTLTLKSKFINKVAGYTLGIYLIHENEFVRTRLYRFLGFHDTANYSSTIIVKVLGAAVLIFVVCFLIEFIRRTIFDFIYNRKISGKIRKKYQGYIASLGMNVPW